MRENRGNVFCEVTMFELKYPLFDGERIRNSAAVTIEDGFITSVTDCAPEDCDDGFLMPGLIDAHTHMGTMMQAESMLQNGISATCDVDGSQSLISSSRQLKIISSAGMAMGMVMNPKGFVERAVEKGARYIKVLLFSTLSIGKPALCGIVKAAHTRGLKVAAHATQIATVRQAVEAGADILIHVPMKGEYPPVLAKTIAENGIAVAPTLVMMETFANSRRNGYIPEHYGNAEKAVKLLHESGVKILAATDANSGSFAPGVAFGTSMHREMELMVKSGMTPTEVLASATSQSAEVFGINEFGMIKAGKRADLLLVEGRPDKNITDTKKVKQLWIDGKLII